MFELFFIITLQDLTIREQWPNGYTSEVHCMEDGWLKADEHKETIVERYPDLQRFDIECDPSGDNTPINTSLFIKG